MRSPLQRWATDRAARRLQRQCARVLEDLEIPDPFDLEAFLAALAASRGRPLTLYPLPDGVTDAPSGMWVQVPDRDMIFVDSGVGPWFRELSVMHECAHMLSDHPPTVSAPDWLGVHVPADAAGRVLMRTVYSSPQEREAELIASMIQARVTRRTGASPTLSPPPAEVAEALRRLSGALGSPRAGER